MCKPNKKLVVFSVGILLICASYCGASTIVTCPVVQDAEVRQCSPSGEFGTYDELAIGKGDIAGDCLWESFIQYDLSAIPSNKIVLNAWFEFYCNTNSITGSWDPDLRVVVDSWSETGINWNNAPDVYPTDCFPDEEFDGSDVNTWWILTNYCSSGMPCDCATLVQGWLDYRDYGGAWPDAYPNYGVRFSCRDCWLQDYDYLAVFNSRESSSNHPVLRVEYGDLYKVSGYISNSVEPDVCVEGLTVMAGRESAVTNSDGYYEMWLPEGTYNVCISEEGCAEDWWFSPGSCQQVDITGSNETADFEITAHAITLDGASLVDDSYVNCSDGNETENYCDRSDLIIGNYRESLIRFDLNSLPDGANILAADISLYCAGQTGGGDINVEFHRITDDWSDCAVTCNNQPAYLSSVLVSDAFAYGERNYIDLTDVVTDWYLGNYSNYGLYLTAAEGLTLPRSVHYGSSEGSTSQRPFLKIAYQTIPEWTILVFSNGDNDVEEYAFRDIDSMETVGSTASVNVIVQLDRIAGNYTTNPDWEETRRYYITQDNTMNEINSIRLAMPDPQERNMGDPNELVDFVIWGINNYSAKRYAVVIWNHGDGWYKKDSNANSAAFLGFGEDFTDNDSIGVADGELNTALESIYNHLGRKIDVVAYNACLMQMWEVIDVTQNYADFVVGSEEKMWANHGLGYNNILSVLTAFPDETDAEDLAILMTESAYGDGQDPSGDNITAQRTTSCVQSSLIHTLTTAMQNFSFELIVACGNESDWTILKGIRNDIRIEEHEFAIDEPPINGNHIDLYDYSNRVYNNTALPSELRSAAYSVREAVSYVSIYHREMETMENDYSWAEGIAIYYPINASEYNNTYNNLPVADNTMWDEFISYYQIAFDQPVGDEQWIIGSQHNIEWHIDIIDWFNIYSLEYSTSGSEGPWLPIVPACADNFYDWTIPNTPSEQCHIRVCDHSGFPCAVSEEFTIPEPTITLQYPNGGEILMAGTCYDIEWNTGGGPVENVRIELSTDGGNSWEEPPIVASTSNTGSYEWCIPVLTSSNECRIRICETDGSPCDVSDANFTSGSIMVIQPNGYETLYAGCSYPVQWAYSPEAGIGNVKIEYSTIGPNGPWREIISSTPNDGEYIWDPILDIPSCLAYIRISANGGDPIDRSNDAFCVYQFSSLEIQGIQNVEENTLQQYECIAIYDDGSVYGAEIALGNCEVTWSENCGQYGSIDNCGLFSANEVTGNENCQITAEFNQCNSTRQTSFNISILDQDPSYYSISGHVYYYNPEKDVPSVDIDITPAVAPTQTTDLTGNYAFIDLSPETYTISASKSGSDACVTVADIIKIRRHLAYLEVFDTPYKLIAADINGSASVSVADVIKLRRYLAQIEPLESGNWTFIDSAYAITNSNWSTAPQTVAVSLSDHDINNCSFVGVRMGDVNDTWSPVKAAKPSSSVAKSVILRDAYGIAGDDISIPLLVEANTEIAGFELHLKYDAENLDFARIKSELPGELTVNANDDAIHIVWEDINNTVSTESDKPIVLLHFTLKDDFESESAVEIIHAEVVDVVGEPYSLNLINGKIIKGSLSTVLPNEYHLEQNVPNPFNPVTEIRFSLPEASQVNLEIFNIMGQLVKTLINDRLEAGHHSFKWDAGSYASGIYFTRLRAGTFVDTKKMILLK